MSADQLVTYQFLGFVYSVIFIISVVMMAFQLSMIKKTLMEIVEEQQKQTEIFKHIAKIYEKSPK